MRQRMDIVIVSEHEQPHAHGDGKRNDRHDDAYDARRGQQHRREAEDGRNGVEHGNGLLLAQAHVQQLVVEVSPVGMEGALSVQDAACEGKYSIRKRNGQREHRQDKGDDGVELEHSDARI